MGVLAIGNLADVRSDDDAFRRWYDDAMPRVYAYLVARCGGDRDLAEELTQETFIAALAALDRFEGRSDPVTWLIAIARRRLADHVRRQVRQRHGLARLLHRQAVADADVGVWEWASARGDVEAALAALAPDQRLVLVLRAVDGCSIAEIADLMNRSEDAAESLVRRARLTFERVLVRGADHG